MSLSSDELYITYESSILDKFLFLTYMVGLLTLIILLPTPSLYSSDYGIVIWLYLYIPIIFPLAGLMGLIPHYILIYLWGYTIGNKILTIALYYILLISAISIHIIIIQNLMGRHIISSKNMYRIIFIHHILVGIITTIFLIYLWLTLWSPYHPEIIFTAFPLAVNLVIAYLIYNKKLKGK